MEAIANTDGGQYQWRCTRVEVEGAAASAAPAASAMPTAAAAAMAFGAPMMVSEEGSIFFSRTD